MTRLLVMDIQGDKDKRSKREWHPTKRDLAQQQRLAEILDSGDDAQPFETVLGKPNDTAWDEHLARCGCMSRCAGA